MNQGKTTIIGKATADGLAIFDLLSQLNRGEVLTYNRMSQEIGRDVQRNRSGLDSAKRRLLRECGKAVFVIRGVGVRLAEPGDHVIDAKSTVVRTRRAASRGLARASVAQVDEMSQSDRLEHAAHSAVLASVVRGTERRAIDQHRQKVIDSSNQVHIPANVGGAS